MLRSVCLAAAAALLLAIPSSASAYWPYGPWSYGYGYGFNQISSDYMPAPPYYSIYPPVYYSSQITKRHYGAAPYAWPPGMQPITYINSMPVEAVEPLVIENPFVQARRASTTPTEMKTEPNPLKIENPHFVKAGR